MDREELVSAVLAAKCLEYCAQPGVYEAWRKWQGKDGDAPPPPPEVMLSEARLLMIGVAEAMGMLPRGGNGGSPN